MTLNRVVLTGKVVTPPQRHFRPDGSPVIQFPLEINDSEDLKDQGRNPSGAGKALHQTGTGQAGRNRITIVAVGKLAEFDLNLLQSGQSLMVTGKLNLRSWQTPEGKSRTRTEVIASDLRRIEEKSQASGPEK
jgi:single-strand DNA-binding protein